MNSTQDTRLFRVNTPLDDNVLLFQRMTAYEELGRLFEFNVDLLSNDESIAIPDLLGQSMTVVADLQGDGHRYFNGIVKRFAHAGRHGQFAKYRATLVPWLWCLTRTADCRIFQHATVPDIIKQVVRDQGFTDFQERLSGIYAEREYCVQYRESDFNFLSRLMEQEGIYYYFTHEDGKHVMILSDDYSSHQPAAGFETIPFFPPDVHQRRDRDHIFDWSVSQQVRSGAYVLNDFNFEHPKADLLVKSKEDRDHTHSSFEIYDYPGVYLHTGAGDEYVRKRIEEQQTEYERVRGVADARGLETGALFTLEGYPRSDQNREYLLVSTNQEIQNNTYETGRGEQGEVEWQCRFEAIDSRQPFRSSRLTPKAAIHGPQTAIVVGKKGEEIWTDKYGRVKVQFHWDRYGKSDENSSCWVRVAQLWAGKSWGAMYIPRVGQEVIIEFLEGDPDRPIVTGRVYNAEEMPPYALPENQTQSGIKSRSTKQANQQQFNELRFEDKKDEEHIYFHAEKDFERIVENNDVLRVGHEKKDKGDQTIEIHNNQTLTIGNSEADDGSQSIAIWNNQSETVENGDVKYTVKKGKRTSEIQGDDSLTIKAGNQTIKISSGKQETEAAQSILLKVGASSIKIEPSSITLKSVMIKIEGDAKADLKAPMTTCQGDAMLTLKGGMTAIN